MPRGCRSIRLFFLAAVPCALLGCSDEAPKRLSDSLAQVGIKDVAVDETNISATCSQGDKITIPTAELERNFLGMSNPKKVVMVAKNVAKECEEKDTAKKREQAQKARLTDTLKELGIDGAGLDDAAAKKAICTKLTEKLPRKELERVQEGAKNTREWGCEAPPPLSALPGGEWIVSTEKAEGKKPQTMFARLVNPDGDRFTLRCVGVGKKAKAEVYVSLAEKTKVKKGTKFVMASIDGQKPLKWKTNVAKDLSAIFLEPKDAKPALARAQKLNVDVPTAKKPHKAAFDTKGFGEAIKDFPPACK